jgi:hypothetical protein
MAWLVRGYKYSSTQGSRMRYAVAEISGLLDLIEVVISNQKNKKL